MKPLIAFYSHSGATKRLAQLLAEETQGELLELLPETPYAYDYQTVVKESSRQISEGYCPKLLSQPKTIDPYDVVFVGSPNWMGQFAPPVLTFLRGADWHGKTVVPFCTHGGGGFGIMEKRFAEECRGAAIKPGLALPAGFKDTDVSAWLRQQRF